MSKAPIINGMAHQHSPSAQRMIIAMTHAQGEQCNPHIPVCETMHRTTIQAKEALLTIFDSVGHSIATASSGGCFRGQSCWAAEN
eukprot:scaffold94037_cov31-Prasinocladus_malaysianus.AAC.1